MPHAVLLAGPEGIGKFPLALAVAKGRLCPRGGGADACGSCPSCRKFSSGNHPDFFLVEPKSGGARRIGIGAIRGGEEEAGESGRREGRGGEPASSPARPLGLLEWIARRPLEGEARCALVRDADRMNPFAQGALLKTLEEPPGDSLLLLTALAAGGLAETIVSRCGVLRLLPLPTAIVEKFLLEKANAKAEDARAAAAVAGGSLGRALEHHRGEAGRMTMLVERSLSSPAEPWALREEAFASLPPRAQASDRRERARTFFECAASALRARWRASVACGGTPSYLPGEPARSARTLESLLEVTGRALRDLEAHVEPGLLLDLFALDLARSEPPWTSTRRFASA